MLISPIYLMMKMTMLHWMVSPEHCPGQVMSLESGGDQVETTQCVTVVTLSHQEEMSSDVTAAQGYTVIVISTINNLSLLLLFH